MDDNAMLTKAIEKAIAGGWRGVPSTSFKEGYGAGVYISGPELLKWRFELWHGSLNCGEYDDFEEVRIESIIFNHDFAKALWGHQTKHFAMKTVEGASEVSLPMWTYHLQQMVIADDPIKYLKENI